MKTSLLSAFALLAVVACGSNPPAADPTSTTAAPVTTPADPAAETATAVTTPSDPGCKSASAPTGEKDLAGCVKGCEGLEDSVPPGSRCISAKSSCTAQCNAQFKK